MIGTDVEPEPVPAGRLSAPANPDAVTAAADRVTRSPGRRSATFDSSL